MVGAIDNGVRHHHRTRVPIGVFGPTKFVAQGDVLEFVPACTKVSPQSQTIYFISSGRPRMFYQWAQEPKQGPNTFLHLPRSFDRHAATVLRQQRLRDSLTSGFDSPIVNGEQRLELATSFFLKLDCKVMAT